MKRMLLFIFMAVMPAALNAAAIYQNDNQSAESIRTLNRFASTEVDAAYFNPAGLSFMKTEGLHLYVSDQMIFQKRQVKDNSTAEMTYYGGGEPVTFDSMASTYGYPDLYAVWKKDELALYAHVCFLGAGAYADYKDGSSSFNGLALQYATTILQTQFGGSTLVPTTVNPAGYKADTSLNAYMVMLGSTIGASYKVLPTLSIAGGVRHVYGLQDKEFDIRYRSILGSGGETLANPAVAAFFSDTDIRTVADGHAAGFIGSVDIRPVEELLIALKYEYYTPLTLENDKPKAYTAPAAMASFVSAFRKGYETKTPLPMSLAMGVSYMITPELKTEGSFSYYFNSLADWGRGEQGTVIAGKKINDYIDNSWAAGISVEYAVMSNLKASIGGTYSVSGLNTDVRSDLNYSPDVVALGTGLTWGVTKDMDLTFGFMTCFYRDQDGTNFDTTLDATAADQELKIPYTVSFALGMTYRIAM